MKDVRQRGFQHRTDVDEVLDWIDHEVQPLPGEQVSLDDLTNRILAAPVVSPIHVPNFRRAMMDGYAICADDSSDASTYNRLPLNVVGEIFPGQVSDLQVARGSSVRIMTGAPLPEGANAVLPFELTVEENGNIFAIDSVAVGKHVGEIGEDVRAGSLVLNKGRKIRPQDIGILASIGHATATVIRKPRVKIIVTGNELLPPGSEPHGPRIVDSNSPMLGSLVRRDGGVASISRLADDRECIAAELQDESCDIVIVSGGTSVGAEDYAPMVVRELGSLKFHGIAMRPSSPTGLGKIGDRLVFLLPGNPVSCLCAYDFFAGRSIRLMGGLAPQWPYRTQSCCLSAKVVSAIGRVDYVRVAVEEDLASPVAVRGASVLSSTVHAAGFVIVPRDLEGYATGTSVDVYLYD